MRKMADASHVMDTRYENFDTNIDGFPDSFADFDKELKQQIGSMKKELDVSALGTYMKLQTAVSLLSKGFGL